MLYKELNKEESLISCFKLAKKTKTIESGYVVKDISFKVRCGEIFGIIGPSGAGKSTIFNMLSMIDARDSG